MKTIKILVFTLLCLNFTQAQNKKWTLIECVDYAIANNITIKQSEIDLESASIDKLSALGAFMPSLGSNANYSINTGANINPATNQFQNETFKSFSAGVNSGVSIFNGLANWKTLQRAKLNKIALEYRLEKMKDDIALAVANSYLQILVQKEQLKVQQNQLQLTKENIKRTQDLINAGQLPAGDVYELQATEAAQEQQIIITQSNLFIAKIGLCQTLLLKEYETFDVVDEMDGILISDMLKEDKESIYLKAKESVNDIKVALSNYDIAKKDVAIARSSYLPSLSGFVGYNARWAESIPFNFTDQLYLFDGTSIGLQLNIPVLNGFANRTRVQRAKVNEAKAALQVTQAELDLERNVYQAYNDLINSKKTYEASQKTLEARSQAYNFAKERFQVGLMNSYDFSQATIAYENAQSDVIRAKYDFIFRTKILEFYFGIPLIK